MSAHRFYLPPDKCRGDTFFLSGREAHHARDVLRLRSGDKVTVLDGAGLESLCELFDLQKDRLGLKVLESKRHPEPGWKVTLFQAVPRGKIIETLIQKATELGVNRIVPILSSRVVSQLNQQEAAEKQAKWQMVAVEAIKQCGSPWLPVVATPSEISSALVQNKLFDLSLVGSLQSDARHPRELFRAFEASHQRRPASVAVWVGPEGDFTHEELFSIQSVGTQPITLGSLVLRVETAAIFCLALISYELQAPATS